MRCELALPLFVYLIFWSFVRVSTAKKKRSEAKPAAMVRVKWTDAAMSTSPHWQEGAQPKPPKGKSMHVCLTVGWLVHLDERWCQVVATLTDGGHAHVTEIPTGMIETIEVLEPAGEMGA
jgi:hypothetical protein